MPIPDEQGALFILFEALAYRGIEAARKAKGLSPKLEKAVEVHTVFSIGDVESLYRTRDKKGRFPDDTVIRLEPPNHQAGSMAILWCRWDFDEAPPRCGYYYGVWYMLKAPLGTTASDGKSVPAFLGYRFETPERGLNHNYYHCQPCLNMGSREAPIEHAIERSAYYPTWPLAAGTAVELLLCVVLTLYGFEGFNELANEVLQRRVAQKNTPLTVAISNIKKLAIRT